MTLEWLQRVAGLVGEVEGADFGDERLRKRAMRLMQSLAAEPDRSLPKALGDEAGLEAAYRFFNNDSVSPEKLLEPHVEATLDRMRARDVVLAVHDTTTMSFRPDGQREGLGRIRSTGQAFFAHFTLAVAADGTREPLGVLAIRSHVRGPVKGAKEQDRWGVQVERVAARIDTRRTVHVMDREADDYALFAQLAAAKHRFIIRVAHDRLLASTDEHAAQRLQEALAEVRVHATREVSLTRRPKAGRSPKQLQIHPAREGRTAKLAFGSTTVTLRRPTTQSRKLPEELTVNVVRVWEPEPPQGEAPVQWTLLTTELIHDLDDLLRVVDYYRARWVIEEYFKALKTGCAYQKRQLETLDALLNVLAFYAPIAWQLLRFRSEARRAPGAPAALVLTETQIQVLRRFRRKPLPDQPTARDVLLAVAALGGHLKRNGEPGWQTLGAGYQKLMTLTEGWEAALEKSSERNDQS